MITHFARLELADELGMDQVKGARLGGEHVGAIQLAESERAEAERIAHADDLVFAHDHERKGALDFPQRGEDVTLSVRVRHQVEDDLAIDGGLENGALLLQLVAHGGGVDQVAVVADGDLPARGIGDERLRVGQIAGAGGGVANVADGARAFQPVERVGREDLRDEAHADVAGEGALRAHRR